MSDNSAEQIMVEAQKRFEEQQRIEKAKLAELEAEAAKTAPLPATPIEAENSQAASQPQDAVTLPVIEQEVLPTPQAHIQSALLAYVKLPKYPECDERPKVHSQEIQDLVKEAVSSNRMAKPEGWIKDASTIKEDGKDKLDLGALMNAYAPCVIGVPREKRVDGQIVYDVIEVKREMIDDGKGKGGKLPIGVIIDGDIPEPKSDSLLKLRHIEDVGDARNELEKNALEKQKLDSESNIVDGRKFSTVSEVLAFVVKALRMAEEQAKALLNPVAQMQERMTELTPINPDPRAPTVAQNQGKVQDIGQSRVPLL